MTALEKATAILPDMSQSEIAQLVQRAARKIAAGFPGIENTPGVCGGSACIIRTRIPVWSIVEFMQMGSGRRDIACQKDTQKKYEHSKYKQLDQNQPKPKHDAPLRHCERSEAI